MVQDKFGVDVTEERWKAVDMTIKRFIRRYPLHWDMWKKQMAAERSTYNVATEGDLKKSGFRNTASFPVVYRKVRGAVIGEDEEEVDSLYETLIMLLPGLVDPDKPGSPNKLFKEFLRRYPLFVPGEHI